MEEVEKGEEGGGGTRGGGKGGGRGGEDFFYVFDELVVGEEEEGNYAEFINKIANLMDVSVDICPFFFV